MFACQFICYTVLFISVQGRNIIDGFPNTKKTPLLPEDQNKVVDVTTYALNDNNKIYPNINREHYPVASEDRKAQDDDETSSVHPEFMKFKVPLIGDEHKQLSVVGSLSGGKDGSIGLGGSGLVFQTDDGHGLALSGRSISGVGKQITGSGAVNLLNHDKHNLKANVFAIRTMPDSPVVDNLNTAGGTLDYIYNEMISGSLGMSHTDVLDRTDYSATGTINLYKDRGLSVDLNAGLTKSISKHKSPSSWQPSSGITFTKLW